MKHPVHVFVLASSLPVLAPSTYADGLGEFYAKLDVDAQISEEGDGRFSEIRSNNSWIGVKGKAPINDNLFAVYRLEWKVDITAEKGQSTFTERPQYVGLSGGFGTLTFGRDFTALWRTQGKLDLFNHYEGDIKGIWKGENRLSDVATYTSPNLQGFYGVLTYQADKTADGDSATSAAVFYGDKQLKSSNVFASLAHDFDVAGYDVTRASMQYRFDNTKLGLMWQTQKATDAQSRNGAFVSASHRFGKLVGKLQYQTMEDDKTISAGVDYLLGKKFKVYAWYSRIDQQDKADRNYLAIGFQYNLSYGF